MCTCFYGFYLFPLLFANSETSIFRIQSFTLFPLLDLGYESIKSRFQTCCWLFSRFCYLVMYIHIDRSNQIVNFDFNGMLYCRCNMASKLNICLLPADFRYQIIKLLDFFSLPTFLYRMTLICIGSPPPHIKLNVQIRILCFFIITPLFSNDFASKWTKEKMAQDYF